MASANPRISPSERVSRTIMSGPGSRVSPSRTPRGSCVSPDSSGSGRPSSSDRRTSPKPSSHSEKRVFKVSELQSQLKQKHEEMRRLKEERSHALRELEDAKKRISSQDDLNEDLKLFRNRVDFLETEVEKAKESEGKMLESLISQTKLLESTKISLEEAKLEVRAFEDGMRSSEGSSRRGSDNRGIGRGGSFDWSFTDEEVTALKNELRMALRAEEESKKAMDDLAIALKEVSTEANQTNGELLAARSELDNARKEAEHSKSLLRSAEDKYRVARELSEKLRLEMEESLVAWNDKEAGFINCMKLSEEEMGKAKRENERLNESVRLVREENAKLRDILRQAVNEASVVKESLEITRNENCHLKDMLTEKENMLRSTREDYECLKVSEAAALDSVDKLKGLLAAASITEPAKLSPPKTGKASSAMSRSSSTSGLFRRSSGMPGDPGTDKAVSRFASDRWKADNARARGWRRNSASSSRLKGSVFDPSESPERGDDRDHMFASISNISDWKVPSSASAAGDDPGISCFDDYYDVDDNAQHLDASEQQNGSKNTKKKHVIGLFGDIFKRKNSHRQC